MSILGVNFQALGKSTHSCSASSTLPVDNVENFSLADFEHYCNPTDINIKVKLESQNKNDDEATEILEPQELSEQLDSELNVRQQLWLESEQESNETMGNSLTLSPSLYSSNEQQTISVETRSEEDQYITIKDSNSSSMETPPNSLKSFATQWTNIQAQDSEVEARYIISTSPLKLTGDSEFTKSDHFPNIQGMVNTSVLEKARPIPSSWLDTHDHETTSHLPETAVVTVPQIYSQTQSQPFRVELGNDGQQYMIMDEKYFSDNAQDITSFQVGSNNSYYFTGTHLLAEYPTLNPPSASQSTSTGGTSTCTNQDISVMNPMNAFQNYSDNDSQVHDKEVLEEQKRKEQMQKRRREKNKDCSRAFRRNQKEKERKLRESRFERQGRLRELNRKNENLIRMLSKVALQGCEKAKNIAANGMESWNKENKSDCLFTCKM